MTPRTRLAVDIGGTFTDLVLSLADRTLSRKLLTTHGHPDAAVIEVPAVIGAAGPRPLPLAPPGPLLRGLIAHVSAYEELGVDAALHGGRSRVLAALLAHPLVGQFDLANRLADRLISENEQYLPWAGEARP